MDVSLATAPGSVGQPNEDFAAATGSVVVVLDGVTQRPGRPTGCAHDVPWYVGQLGTRLLASAVLAPGSGLADTLAGSIIEVAALHSQTCDLSHPGSLAATVAILRERDNGVDYLVLSDCVLLAEGPGGLRVITDDRVEQLPPGDAGQAPAGLPLTRQHITGRQRHRNQPGGYWVAAADPVAAGQALTGTRDRSDLRPAAILTDGASRLVDRFALADWPGLLRQLEASGPAGIIRRVREAESTDPDGSRWPRYKRSDDATAALCLLTTCDTTDAG
jgi:hypothetical protein